MVDIENSMTKFETIGIQPQSLFRWTAFIIPHPPPKDNIPKKRKKGRREVLPPGNPPLSASGPVLGRLVLSDLLPLVFPAGPGGGPAVGHLVLDGTSARSHGQLAAAAVFGGAAGQVAGLPDVGDGTPPAWRAAWSPPLWWGCTWWGGPVYKVNSYGFAPSCVCWLACGDNTGG